MRRLGIIGGMSWHSTAKYYEQLNAGVQKRLGGHHSAELIIRSLDFARVEELQRADDWPALDDLMLNAGEALKKAGADGLLIAANTMHKSAPALRALGLPIVHIADAIAAEAKGLGMRRLGLLGTRFVMAEDFLQKALAAHGLTVHTPEPQQQGQIDALIFDELVHGSISASSNTLGLQIIDGLYNDGCEAVTLACTELGIPRWHEQTRTPLIDSQRAHVALALDWLLAN